MHRLYSAVEKDGEIYAAKFTVKETSKGSDNPVHAYEVTEIELPDDLQTPGNTGVPGAAPNHTNNSITGASY